MKEIGWVNTPRLARTGSSTPPSFIIAWPSLGAVQGVAGARMMSTSSNSFSTVGAILAAEALRLDVPRARQQRARHQALARVGIEILRPRCAAAAGGAAPPSMAVMT